VCYTGLWIHWFRDLGTTILNGLVTTGWTSLVGVGHSRSDSIVPLMLRTVCYAMDGALALYYRSLVIASILLRMNTTGRTSLVGVGHSRLNSIVSLIIRTVCYAMDGALTLYYRSLGTASTLLRMNNILSRPYC
jgi:hypothetical protein